MKQRKSKRGVITSMTLCNVYAHTGDYSAKLIIDQAASLGIESVDVDIRNADGKTMQFKSSRWGTKISISFKIDESTPDGVSVVDLTFHHSKYNDATRERFDFWVIKD